MNTLTEERPRNITSDLRLIINSPPIPQDVFSQVYIVIGHSNGVDDGHEWIVSVHLSEYKAQRNADKLSRITNDVISENRTDRGSTDIGAVYQIMSHMDRSLYLSEYENFHKVEYIVTGPVPFYRT